MAFKLDVSDRYTWPVEIAMPADGKAAKFGFDAVFRRLPRSEIDELMRQAEKGEIDDAAFASRVLCGWKGVTDEKGEEVPYSESAKDALLDIYPVAACIVESYVKSLTEGRRKN